MAVRRIVFFYVGDQVYGLDVSCTQGIEKVQSLLTVPNTLSHIKGLINIRGEAIPVFSLRAKFGMNHLPPAKNPELIVVRLKIGIPLAFEVDSIKEIKEIEDNAEDLPPALIQIGDTGYISRVLHIGKGLVLLIDPEGTLTQEEKEKLIEYMEKMKIKNEEAEAKKKAGGA